MNRVAKIMGKIFTYLGLLMGFAGIVKLENLPWLLIGIIMMVIGCLMHEVNEK